MQTICVSQKTGKDVALLLRIPLDKPEAEFEVVGSMHFRKIVNDLILGNIAPLRPIVQVVSQIIEGGACES